ncbi:MAG TPA: YggS family pyridoxal phosphate-dependent enzyme [Candidatus Limnocylindrales bacterium]|nr:YggS family pyridoxal phosphate-dependent enzyme [Candidatus Limnocylindrales bacterium]
MPDLAEARDAVLERIARAATRAARAADAVQLVAVTKTLPPERVRDAIAAGLTVLGENRVQEGEAKRSLAPGATWHLIGPLQSNKARRAIETFDVIESVDSVELAERLSRLADEAARDPLPVLLQVNVDADPAKAGFTPDGLAAALPRILDLGGLGVDGLMTVGRLVERPEDARPTFVALRRLSERLRRVDGRLGAALSMGMTDDFEIAVEEGATIVRVGRALFGERA